MNAVVNLGRRRRASAQAARLVRRALVAGVLILAASPASAADPGAPYPAGSALSDDKVGSVLIFNLFTSSAVGPNAQNTDLSITNTNDTQFASVRLFFIEPTGSVSSAPPFDLVPNQVVSLLTSDLVPGRTGFAIAMAIDRTTGCPASFNWLSGNAAVKLNSGQQADLPAVAVSALYSGIIAGCSATSTSATLAFDDVVYNRLPATVAVDSYGAAADGNDGRYVLNRIGGSLISGPATFGSYNFEVVESDTTTTSGIIASSSTQVLGQTNILVAPPAGTTAWAKFFVDANSAIIGAFLNYNPNATAAAAAFTGGHNMHTLTLATETLEVPVWAPGNNPGTPFPATSAASDNRAGSVLIYHLTDSSLSSPASRNASITVTNTQDSEVRLRIYLVDGATGAVFEAAGDVLPPFATGTGYADSFAPGFRGYIILVAADPDSGCPIAYNHLIGDIDVKLSTGHYASLPATAVAALYSGTLSGCPGDDTAMHFDGVEYTLLPYVLALDNFGSRLDGNDTLLVLDHPGGDLDTSLSPLGTVNGSLFDDATNEYPFTFNAPPQQFAALSNSFPPTTPNLDTIVPAGRTGWLKAYPPANTAMVGSVLSFNPNASAASGAFNGGHNLHVLTLTTDELDVEAFPTDTPTPTPTATATGTATSTATATLIPAGGACTVASACASGFCVDTVCCNTACDGANESCDQRGFEGTCRPLPAAAPALSPGAVLFAVALLVGIGLLALRQRRSAPLP